MVIIDKVYSMFYSCKGFKPFQSIYLHMKQVDCWMNCYTLLKPKLQCNVHKRETCSDTKLNIMPYTAQLPSQFGIFCTLQNTYSSGFSCLSAAHQYK